jgi:hypothetical protein
MGHGQGRLTTGVPADILRRPLQSGLPGEHAAQHIADRGGMIEPSLGSAKRSGTYYSSVQAL